MLITVIVAGSSIASTMIMLSIVSNRENQQNVPPAVAELPKERAPTRPLPSVPVTSTRKLEPTPNRSASDKFAVPTDAQLDEEKNGLTLVGEFSASELLEQASKDTHHPSMRYLLYRMSIDQGIKEGNLPIAMRAVDSIVARWDVLDPDAYRSEVQSQFAASKPAQPSVSETLIAATEAPDNSPQPPPVDRQNSLILKGVAIDLTRKKTSIPITLSHVDIEDSRSLRVEVSSVAGATAQKFYPAERVAKLGSKLRIAFREIQPMAGIQVSLSPGTSITQVQFEPIMIAFDNKEHPWAIDRVKAMLKLQDSIVAKQSTGIPAAQAEITNATNDWNALIARYGDNMTAPQVVALTRIARERVSGSEVSGGCAGDVVSRAARHSARHASHSGPSILTLCCNRAGGISEAIACSRS